jgi:hypothetical protein
MIYQYLKVFKSIYRPDAEVMEETISKLSDGLEGLERSGFEELHQFSAKLPVPATKQCSSMTVYNSIYIYIYIW